MRLSTAVVSLGDMAMTDPRTLVVGVICTSCRNSIAVIAEAADLGVG